MGIIENMKRNTSYKDSDVYRPGAFNPGLFELNKKKLKALRPQIFGLRLGQKTSTPGRMSILSSMTAIFIPHWSCPPSRCW